MVWVRGGGGGGGGRRGGVWLVGCDLGFLCGVGDSGTVVGGGGGLKV